MNSESREPIITESKVGLGRMLYAALNPSIFSLTAQNSKLLRELVKHSLERTGQKYAERAAMTVTRGAITGVKTLGRELEIEGLYVNLLSPTLAVEEDPTIRPRSWALLKSFVKSGKTPKILATSGRVVVDFEQTDLSSWIVKAPSGTEGVTRILRNGKSLAGARAYTMGGDSVAVTTYADGDTILLRYDNRAEGIILKVGWK